jgi:hypothetical protein
MKRVFTAVFSLITACTLAACATAGGTVVGAGIGSIAGDTKVGAMIGGGMGLLYDFL